jgi:hypothetical protein
LLQEQTVPVRFLNWVGSQDVQAEALVQVLQVAEQIEQLTEPESKYPVMQTQF